MKYLSALVCCVIFCASVDAARILGIFHVPAKSHHILGTSLMKGLAARGHEVTMLSPFKGKEKIPNYRDVFIDGATEVGEKIKMNLFTQHNQSMFAMFSKFSNFTYDLSFTTLQSNGMKKLLTSGEKFDLIVMEPFGNEAFFGLSHHFNAPIVIVCTMTSQFINHLTGNSAPYSFVPQLFTSYTDKMTFFERFLNMFAGIAYQIMQNYVTLPQQRVIYETIFKNAPDFDEIIKTGALFLINSNVISESPRPYLPNMIPIGGVQIDEPKKLPADLQKFLDDAKDGVIYFSLGSNIKSSDMPIETREAVVKTFAKLKEKVVWKFEVDDLPGKPSNLRIEKWLPQTDILAHPNVKMFISHGGLLSTTEALFRGVPVLGIPFFGDQHTNVATFVASGYGQVLQYSEITEETFTKAVKEVLNNPSYRENIKRTSNIITDNPTKPLERAVFWVEYVLRHKGAAHLRSTALDLPLYQYLMLDVVVFSVAVIGTFLTGIVLVIRRLCCSSKKRKQLDEQSKSKKSKSKRE